MAGITGWTGFLTPFPLFPPVPAYSSLPPVFYQGPFLRPSLERRQRRIPTRSVSKGSPRGACRQTGMEQKETEGREEAAGKVDRITGSTRGVDGAAGRYYPGIVVGGVQTRLAASARDPTWVEASRPDWNRRKQREGRKQPEKWTGSQDPQDQWMSSARDPTKAHASRPGLEQEATEETQRRRPGKGTGSQDGRDREQDPVCTLRYFRSCFLLFLAIPGYSRLPLVPPGGRFRQASCLLSVCPVILSSSVRPPFSPFPSVRSSVRPFQPLFPITSSRKSCHPVHFLFPAKIEFFRIIRIFLANGCGSVDTVCRLAT